MTPRHGAHCAATGARHGAKAGSSRVAPPGRPVKPARILACWLADGARPHSRSPARLLERSDAVRLSNVSVRRAPSGQGEGDACGAGGTRRRTPRQSSRAPSPVLLAWMPPRAPTRTTSFIVPAQGTRGSEARVRGCPAAASSSPAGGAAGATRRVLPSARYCARPSQCQSQLVPGDGCGGGRIFL
jgi:hypothetical protein